MGAAEATEDLLEHLGGGSEVETDKAATGLTEVHAATQGHARVLEEVLVRSDVGRKLEAPAVEPRQICRLGRVMAQTLLNGPGRNAPAVDVDVLHHIAQPLLAVAPRGDGGGNAHPTRPSQEMLGRASLEARFELGGADGRN